MAANNQGIWHLNLNGAVACKRQTAHMYIKIDEFRAYGMANHRRCVRCVALLAKMDASAARKAAREAAAKVGT